MTPFEIIILIAIYLICCGYMAQMFSKVKENVWLRALLVVLSLVLAIYAPLMFGAMLFEKMEKIKL